MEDSYKGGKYGEINSRGKFELNQACEKVKSVLVRVKNRIIYSRVSDYNLRIQFGVMLYSVPVNFRK